jgi:hypothetical protein
MTTGRISQKLQAVHAAFADRLQAARARAAAGEPVRVVCDDRTAIPASFLIEQRRAGAQPCRLEGLSERARVALALLGEAPRYAAVPNEDHQALVADPPFRASLDDDGMLSLALVGNAGHHPRMGGGMCHAWVEAVAVPAVQVDLSAVSHLNSVLIAWMLQLVQGTKPAPFRVRGANAAVATQLKQLRLDYVMNLIGA